MSEVKRYTAWAAEVALPRGTMVVLAADYDALLARAKTAEADFLAAAECNVEQRKTIQRLQAEMATERARADVAVGDANEAERRVAELEAELQALKVVRHWIPVSERLPENDTPILVAYKFGGIYTCRRNVVDHDLTAVDPAHGERDRPTHWMPLPAAPQEDKSHD